MEIEQFFLTREQKIYNLRRLIIKTTKDPKLRDLQLETLSNLTDYQLDLLIDLHQKTLLDRHNES